jgi:tripeptide aminopeptidase
VLQSELEELGAADVRLNSSGYVMATIPPTPREIRIPVVAFLAHVDTAPDFTGESVEPIVHRKYDGGIIRFAKNPDLILDPSTTPELHQAKGKDIVTANGTTLLGADDKAGVAVIMTLVEHLLTHPEVKHGPVRICFTPDEEIGRGVEKLDLRELNARVAYTLDGHEPGQICAETFSADKATIIIKGVSTHPGDAKAKGMVNAVHLAGKFLAALPREHCAPETTCGREGFIHPLEVAGGVERVEIKLILRDFDLSGLDEKRAIIRGLCRGMQAAERRARITCKIKKQYRNMAYWLQQDRLPVELAYEAFRNIGLNPFEEPVRGGTDGSRLTERGLPTPNLFCGMRNIHSPLEWVAVQDMELAVRACARLLELWSEKGKRY